MGGLRPPINLGLGSRRAKFEHMPIFETGSASKRRTTIHSPVIKAKAWSALSKTACIINDLERDRSLNVPVGSKTVGL
jgi:hypothetical protein